jgi:DNA helicase-2/ATP-dependent DNA helicase PcrA
VLERTGYKRYLQEEAERGEERWENIQEFRNTARDFLHLGGRQALTAFLESVSLVSDVDNLEEKPDAITLITLHQAKGLEFRVVFIVGMEEGLLPHMRSIDSGDPGEMEEERRLCYVGITRAKERLYLLRAFRRGFRGGSEPSKPSRYLADIPQHLIVAPRKEPVASAVSTGWRAKRAHSATPDGDGAQPDKPSLATGDKVKHATFGDGIVMSCKVSGVDFEVTVAFKEGKGVKRLLLGLAPLEKVE